MAIQKMRVARGMRIERSGQRRDASEHGDNRRPTRRLPQNDRDVARSGIPKKTTPAKEIKHDAHTYREDAFKAEEMS